MLALPQVVNKLGLDAARLIGEAGLDPDCFVDPENRIRFQDAGRLLAVCTERAACPHLGLLIGQHAGLEALGEVGRLMRNAPDLGTALRALLRYLHLHDRGAVPSLSVHSETAMIGYSIHVLDLGATLQIYDIAVAITYNILRALGGSAWEAREVRLPRPLPADPGPYLGLFRARVRFGAGDAGVVFSSAWLRQPVAGADARVYRKLLVHAGELDAVVSADLPGRLRRVLRRLLMGGAGPDATSLADVATLLAMHPRTLNRRLRAQGTSFREVLDLIRYEIACHLLRDTSLALDEVYGRIGYADLPSFVRAFRRWSGTSPAAWRTARRPP